MDSILSDMQFKSFTIGGFDCNINRNKLCLMSSFEDIAMKNSAETGFNIITKNDKGNQEEYQLNPVNVRNMCIELPEDETVSNEQFYERYHKIRSPYWGQLMRNLYSKKFGFEKPSAIQEIAIPELINYKDALIHFKSGMGKTIAFLVGMLWGLEPNLQKLQYVFMTSTHQIAYQIYEQVKDLVPDSVKVGICIGYKKANNRGMGNGAFKEPLKKTSELTDNKKPIKMTLKEEIDNLKNAQIIVCTMGKFHDYLIDRNFIPRLDYLKGFCVDEFDAIVTPKSQRRDNREMNQINDIMEKVPSYTQRAFFSATVTSDSLNLASKYFRKYSPHVGDPFVILLNEDDYTLDGIRQYYVEVQSYQEKKQCLIELMCQLRISQGIVFVNKIETAEDIKSFLDNQRFSMPSSVFHGNLTSDERNEIYANFKEYKYRLLIATDVLARGIDVQSINVVINFDMPREQATYIHRVGRSGRYGRKGTAITFVLVNPAIKINEMLSVEAINDCSKNNKMQELPDNLPNLL